MATKAKELRNLGREELRTRLDEAYQEFFNLRFRQATRQLSDTSVLKRARRDIARIRTLIREKELAEERATHEG